MKNIFENAHFGKLYKTRDGHDAVYLFAYDCIIKKTHNLVVNVHYDDTHLCEIVTGDDGSVGSIESPFDIISECQEPIDDTIVLTRYYEDYEKEHKRFVNMLKHQEQYKDCTDEEIEEIWKDHIKEVYTFDEIWSTIQCEGYTKIVLRMGRHDIQPDYDYVLETKEYIDEKMKKYL